MSREKLQDVNIFLDRLMKAYGFVKDYELAEFLEVKPATISAWKKRKSPDYLKIFTICKNISAEYLFLGIEPMFIKDAPAVDASSTPPTTCNADSVSQKICEACEQLTKEGKEYILNAAKHLVLLTDLKTSGYKRESSGGAKTKKTA